MSYDLQSVYGSGFGGGGNAGGGNSYGRLESSTPAPGLLNYPGPSYEVSESSSLSCANGSCGGEQSKDVTYSGSILNSRNAPTTPVLTRILVVLVSLSLILSLSLLILAAMHSK